MRAFQMSSRAERSAVEGSAFLNISSCAKVLRICASIFIASSLSAQTPLRQPADLPDEITTQVEKDFEMPDCFEEGTPPLRAKISTEQVDLTKTVDFVLLISGTGRCLRGTNDNIPFLVYSRFGNNWRAILKAEGESFEPLPSMQSGWRDVQVTYRNSESESARYLYRFSKNEYRSVSCELLTKGSVARKPCPGWKAK